MRVRKRISKKYDVILADCPWSYSSRGARGGRYGKLDYSSMSVEELKAMDIPSLVADTALLFMWATGTHIFNAGEVANAWGFTYIRYDKTWKKIKSTGGRHGVVGPWGMVDAEHLLLFGKGSPHSMQKENNQWTVYESPYTGKHSGKPPIFRKMIDRRVGDEVNKLELFARYKADNWAVFGDEVEGSIVIPQR